MTALALVRQLWKHNFWADEALRAALVGHTAPPAEAWREYTHILGAEEVWLARLLGRSSRTPVWPTLLSEEALVLQRSVRSEYESMLAGMDEAGLERSLDYLTSRGEPFSNTVGEVLVHVAMHGQYHRGKVNVLLRQAEREPAPADYITFVRGTRT